MRRPALAAAESRPAGTLEEANKEASQQGNKEADPAAAVTPPLPPPPGIQGEGSEEVYWLTIRSIPSGADVLIDGQVEGKTPFVRRIFDPTRSYALPIRRPGFEPHERTLSSSDVWTKRGNVRTLTVVAKLAPASGPVPTEPPPPVRTRTGRRAGDRRSTAAGGAAAGRARPQEQSFAEPRPPAAPSRTPEAKARLA